MLQSDSYKYLGVDIVSKHSWGATVDRFICTAERKANRLRGAGCASAFMGVAVVRKLYMSLVRPGPRSSLRLRYGSRPTLAQLKKMDSVLVQFARKSLGLPPWTSNAAVREEIGVWPQWARQDFLQCSALFWVSAGALAPPIVCYVGAFFFAASRSTGAGLDRSVRGVLFSK